MRQKPAIFILSLAMFALMAFVPAPSDPSEVSIGSYSLSLNVRDISASKDFYHKLGFTPMPGMGSIEQKWMILSNGEVRIGLFQGMFPSNTITFNPTDGRSVYQTLKDDGIEPTFASGMDKPEGPCTFSIADPDGNPILIDQH